MQTALCLFLVLASVFATGQSLRETPQQALNQYVSFLNQSVDEVASHLQKIQSYHAAMSSYQSHKGFGLNLSSSGPMEDYYYKKALTSVALTEAEKKRLNASTEALWGLTIKIDQTTKALETYNRLKDYERDNFKQATELITTFQTLTSQFKQDKEAFYKQIQQVYRRYQPYRPTDAYLYTEKEMEQVLVSQQQLLDTIRYYLNKGNRSDWPVELVQKSILADEKLLAGFGKGKLAIDYPAMDMITSFRAGLQTIQALKRTAVDEYTFAARQSTAHGNEFYRSFINRYNNDLLSWQQSFVKYSSPAKQLLDYPKYSPVFAVDVPAETALPTSRAKPFRDVAPIAFTTRPATAPASSATFQALNSYVDFINESLRQLNQMQNLMRNYQSSAESYQASLARGTKRSGLSYSHETYKVPLSEYQNLAINNPRIPPSYRISISGQADVLLGILTEMDELSIELIDYVSKNQYVQDHMQRSNEILDRYAYLFDTFDKKKERLYLDVRRIYNSYPVKNPADSWSVAGKVMLQLLDIDKEILFGMRAYMRGEVAQAPTTDTAEAKARELITNEYQNLKGLQRLGRSNGLCPYTRYEDLAENSLRLAAMVQKTKMPSSAFTTHPYESFYYFFNNELVYAYNEFSDLAKADLLKAINEPNLFAFRRSVPLTTPVRAPEKADQLTNKPAEPVISLSQPKTTGGLVVTTTLPPTNGNTVTSHDTVYVNRNTVDTVYIDRNNPQTIPASLTGFAANNMVLLLDVSASMDSPFKMPLLKKSIKSLLSLLRPEDQLSIVVYSGKARVALKPTSGADADEIARVIDQLQSNGDTDGNGGIELAYKLANKNYIRAGNNRIVLATDGEFPVRNDVYELVGESSRQDVYLTIFTFGRKEINSQNLKKLAQLGKGTYAHITADNANLQLILEAQSKKVP